MEDRKRVGHYPGCKCPEEQEICSDFSAFLRWLRPLQARRRELLPDDAATQIVDVLITAVDWYEKQLDEMTVVVHNLTVEVKKVQKKAERELICKHRTISNR